MLATDEIICIQCPLACRVKITTDDAGEVKEAIDFGCKEGQKYAVQELISPKRVLTATVRTEGSVRRLLPVRTKEPIPKNMLEECMDFLSEVRLKLGVRMGEVIVPNILGTGVDVICSGDLLE